MRKLLLPVLLMGSLVTFGQRTIDVTSGDVNVVTLLNSIGGEPVVMAKFTALVEGTPYFRDEWMNGTIVLEGGKEYKNIPIKLDLFHKEVHYKDEKGKEYIATTPIKEVVLSNGISNYRFVHSSSFAASDDIKEGWYLWLHSGQASLYKYFDKKLEEAKPYGSATIEQKIKTSDSYLVYQNYLMMRIKKLKDAPDVLANKRKDIEEFLKSRDKKDASLDDRFTDLIVYYNELIQKKK